VRVPAAFYTSLNCAAMLFAARQYQFRKVPGCTLSARELGNEAACMSRANRGQATRSMENR